MTKKYKSSYYNSGGVYKTRHSPPSNAKTKACQLWENIKNRCEYLPYKDPVRFANYIDVDCCPEWKDFQNFAQWFESVAGNGYFHEGWHLDKDLLVKNNKIYSPETCVFLPEGINKALSTRSRDRGQFPAGLCYGKFSKALGEMTLQVTFSCKHPDFYLKTVVPISKLEEGFKMYKDARESYIRYLAGVHKEQLDPRAYDALMKYEITMED